MGSRLEHRPGLNTVMPKEVEGCTEMYFYLRGKAGEPGDGWDQALNVLAEQLAA